MDYRYYRDDIPTDAYVWFKLIDSDGNLIKDYPDQACFGDITHGFDEAADQIQVYHDRNKVPYDDACIQRWVDDISSMGFPCYFEPEEDPIGTSQLKYVRETCNESLDYMALMILRHGEELESKPTNIFVNLYDYEDKNQLFSALFLIRCLTETGLNRIPEEYFKLMDADPNRDKFDALQTAHKIVSRRKPPYDPRSYANIDHMVTYDGNGENITLATLKERFKGTGLRDKGYTRIHKSWRGEGNIVDPDDY